MRTRGTTAACAYLAAICASACSFEDSATAPSSDAGAPGDPDSGGGDGGEVSADCPAPIHLELSVGGVTEAEPSEPFVRVLVGDTIALSAEGSCSRRGPLEYRWSFEPITTGVATNALPSLTERNLTIFAARPGEYIVTIEITDGDNTLRERFFGFEVHGFELLDVLPADAGDIRDLAVGGDWLWVATSAGSFRVDLTSPQMPAVPLAEIYDGDSLPEAVASVHVDAAGSVWFGGEDEESDVWRLTGTTLEGLSLPESARTRDISAAEGGVRMATDRDIFRYVTGDALEVELEDTLVTVADLNNVGYGGDDKLYVLSDGSPIDLLGGNHKLRALESAGDVLLLGSESKGFAIVDSGLAVLATFTIDQGLPHNFVRAIAHDAAGDYWVATEGGVGRYKQDRGLMITLDDSSVDGKSVRAIATYDGADRAYVAAIGNQLWLLAIPPPG